MLKTFYLISLQFSSLQQPLGVADEEKPDDEKEDMVSIYTFL